MPFRGTLHAHVFAKSQVLRFRINKTIVETIIGDMLLHSDDVDGVTQQRALCTFDVTVDEDFQNGEHDAYLRRVESVMGFQLAVRLATLGYSLRCVSRQLAVFREETGMTEYGGASYVTSLKYVRIVCVASLQHLAEL